MFSTDDTIVAISTAPGRGGIGIVRISGPRATEMAKAVLAGHGALEARRSTLSTVVVPDDSERSIDRVLATYFPAPRSYTGEDTIELSGHGNPVILQEITAVVVQAGARLAEPGEFTLRAFLNGRIDLIQAEAVGDLIAAVTPLQARTALDQLDGTITTLISEIDRQLIDLVARLEASIDFPEEGYHFVTASSVESETRVLATSVGNLLADARRGRLVREGCQVVIVGKPNVGKSTLFNRLLGAPRAIVTDVPGTTRDLLTEVLNLNGVPINLVDTAGIRHTRDTVESEGVLRARGALGVARLVVLVLDCSRPLSSEDLELLQDTQTVDRVIVINKSDLPLSWKPNDLKHEDQVKDSDKLISLSLLDGSALGELQKILIETLLAGEELRDTPAISNLRHIELLERAQVAMINAADTASMQASEELVLADLQEARDAIEAVTGKRTPEDILNRIFETFCIGK